MNDTFILQIKLPLNFITTLLENNVHTAVTEESSFKPAPCLSCSLQVHVRLFLINTKIWLVSLNTAVRSSEETFL